MLCFHRVKNAEGPDGLIFPVSVLKLRDIKIAEIIAVKNQEIIFSEKLLSLFNAPCRSER